MEKKYDHIQSQETIQKIWTDEQIYRFDPSAGPIYSIDTPPPTVSGSLHIGHIFSYTQTDIFARFKRMSGFAVFYPFGFDDNGLPTERYVEKKLKIQARSMPRSEFISTCLEQTKGVEEEFKALWQNMGLSVDWNKSYATIAPEARKISQESFIRLYNKGAIYRKYEPALYCTTCSTSVAQAELDDIEKTSLFSDIHFKSPDGDNLTISTTRPELLASCVALFYHPDDSRYQKLAGKKAIVPIFGHEVPILADETVEQEKGTGLVMCCTFGDKNDIHWFKMHKLPYKQSITNWGKFNAELPVIGNLKVNPAREAILEALKEADLLGSQKETTRPVNVHERCKKEIEYIALSQWFLNVLDHKQEFIKAAESITWHPAHMKSRYINWVENISWDWCLSRQRFYGIPFPVWHCSNGHILLAPVEDLPIDPQETAYPGNCTECDSTDITPDTDVMDTWNTSSLTPQICFSLFDDGKRSPFDKDAIEDFFPMSMRAQAHDIIRTWAFYTIAKAWLHYEMIPWKEVVISGHVLADSKEKLSKSKGNAKLTPEHLLNQYSADVIRYWTASGRLGHDVAFSENQLKIGGRLVTKLWNAFRFVHEHIKEAPKTKPTNLGVVNEWLLHAGSATLTKYKNYLNDYECSLALDTVEHFFWHDFCDNYLELIKNQLFNPQEYTPEEVAATQWTLSHVGLQLLQLYAPYLPYITESLYQNLYKNAVGKPSIHLTQFDTEAHLYQQSADAMKHVNEIVSTVRKLKTEHQLSLKAEIKKLHLHAPAQEILEIVKPLEQIIKGVTHVQLVEYSVSKAAESNLSQADDGIEITTAIGMERA